MENQPKEKLFNIIVIVAALGYFVDIYDLVLFGIVRITSLRDLHVPDEMLKSTGAMLLNWQMGGMMVGGLLWGILGDKKGRISVLFGSILMYSVANILNGMVNSVSAYAALRFIAGIGLAGELGAGITLVSETMSKEKRGYGTMLVATIGISGAVVAALIAEKFNWRISYYVGGAMGLLLLLMRIGVYESGLFENAKTADIERGNFFKLFSSARRATKYLSVILIAVPVWYVVGILMTFSPEIGKAMGMKELPAPGKAIMFCYIGITLGDLASGLYSQLIKSRLKAIGTFMMMTAFTIILYFIFSSRSLFVFYAIATCIGFSTGYWAVFVTTASEQFGTNLRATVTTTAPNFVRGAVVPITFGFIFFDQHFGTVKSAIIVGIITLVIAFLSLRKLEETFGKDLNYLEE